MTDKVAIGVDIGGTFTDVVARDATGRTRIAKVPSTRPDPAEAVRNVLRDLLPSWKVDAAAIERFVHGTTVATNAVLERKGSKLGLLTTAGVTDLLEIGRQSRKQIYDLILKPETKYAPDDHRHFNKLGEAFDAGETFSGLGAHLDDAFAAVEELKKLVPPGQTLAQFALRWILMHDAVTCAIPGAKNPEQAQSNVAAADLPPLTGEQMSAARTVYEKYIQQHVAGRW